MSRYRKIEVRTWSDEKFQRLSPIAPSGQGLWFFLLTGPHTGPIPGLFRAGRAALAEELGWSDEAFGKAFAEVSHQGMAEADFKARLVWLPNAIKHNLPESPNVVKSWASEFDLLPECALKTKALESLRAAIYQRSEAFIQAFDEAFGKALPKAMPNQEQEQEQEQDKASSLRSDSSKVADATPDQFSAKRALRETEITRDAIRAYNATISTKAGGLLPFVRESVGFDNRKAQVRKVLKLASEICSAQYGAPTITPQFWADYFGLCAQDPFLSGNQPGGAGHENWRPTFEHLVKPKTMLGVYDKNANVEEAA